MTYDEYFLKLSVSKSRAIRTPQDVVVQVLQNAAKSSTYRLQNAKSVALCVTHLWGIRRKSPYISRLKIFLALAWELHLYMA